MNQDIHQAVQLLQSGEVVALPTETVYGLAADANNSSAVKKIFDLKGRPSNHPLIVHIADSSFLSHWAIDIPNDAYLLAKQFWPGPLTIILKKAPHVSEIITGKQNTIGLRAPHHPITHQILLLLGGGIAAPSANRFGHVSPTTAMHVQMEFGDKIPLIIDGGPCQVGIESTIIDLSSEPYCLLRPGMITSSMLSHFLKKPVMGALQSSPRVSGSLPRHYSPQTPAKLIESEMLLPFIEKHLEQKLAVIAWQPHSHSHAIWHSLPNDPEKYAQKLYDTLRQVDQLNIDLIIIEKVPDEGKWAAISDRLKRATYLP